MNVSVTIDTRGTKYCLKVLQGLLLDGVIFIEVHLRRVLIYIRTKKTMIKFVQ